MKIKKDFKKGVTPFGGSPTEKMVTTIREIKEENTQDNKKKVFLLISTEDGEFINEIVHGIGQKINELKLVIYANKSMVLRNNMKVIELDLFDKREVNQEEDELILVGLDKEISNELIVEYTTYCTDTAEEDDIEFTIDSLIDATIWNLGVI